MASIFLLNPDSRIKWIQGLVNWQKLNEAPPDLRDGVSSLNCLSLRFRRPPAGCGGGKSSFPRFLPITGGVPPQ